MLTAIGNTVLGTRLTELHSGFRAYSMNVFQQIDIEKNSDNFVFDTEIIIQLIAPQIPIKIRNPGGEVVGGNRVASLFFIQPVDGIRSTDLKEIIIQSIAQRLITK